MKTHVMLHPRAEELLVERALRPLTDAELAELERLGVDPAADETFELAAAAAAVAASAGAAMPQDVMARLMAQLDAAPKPATVIPIQQAKAKRRGVSVVWLAVAAAAGIAIALGIGIIIRDPKVVPPSAAEARAALLDSGTPALTWTATADVAAKGASGDVVWSDTAQRGYMRFVGLAANDPGSWQYQLWIFDKDRDQAFPVDGGVFDVTGSGEVVVPIAAKLHVDRATLFAVTVEKPGGVVVSKRERIVVTAKPS
jgi:anti-sigma-K factor RskA